MKRKSIVLIVALMTIALIGVMAMQLYFFRESYQLQSRLFDQSVHEALKNVIERIEKDDANKFLVRKAENSSQEISDAPAFSTETKMAASNVEVPTTRVLKTKPKFTVRSDEYYLAREQKSADSIFYLRDSLVRTRSPHVLMLDDKLTEAEAKDLQFNLQIDVMQFQDMYGRVHEQTRQTISRMLNRNILASNGAASETSKVKSDSVRIYIIPDPVGGRPSVRIIPKPKMTHFSRPKPPEVKKEAEVKKVQEFLAAEENKERVFKDLSIEYYDANVPLNQRIHPQTLDSMLRVELMNRSIFSSYEYRVTSAKRDSLIFTRASNNTVFLASNTYETPLFPKDMIRDPGILTITFPDKNNVILANLTALMGLSGGLLLILVFCFGYTIHSILRQKKISEMKTDFINNMTHEFKTPVSTIMIASDALRDPDMNVDKRRIDRLANIIYDENVRLGNHIERVLNIAKIDRGDLKLEHKEVEMNDLLAAIADSMTLQLQKRDAEIELSLNAKNSVIMGDELHVSNVIFNLLDNANKYSPEKPRIKVSTFNSGKNLIIKVADQGIGMNRDQLSKIFDQFYRIPTGNLHDVKGFGLGLSYVSDIVKRLKGTIRVRSEKDAGSEFEISIPFKS